MIDQMTITADGEGVLSPLGAPEPTTVPEVIDHLRAIQSWVEENTDGGKHDGVACFNFLYHQVTCRVLEWIDSGRFADANFLTTLDLVFAGRYLAALRADEVDPQTAPSSWEALLEVRNERRISPLQFAVAGVNAHVNFDLPCAVVATCERLGTEPNSGTQRADYDKVNEIFAEEMQSLRRHFENHFERWLDEWLLGHIENVLGNFSVEAARDTAWAQAEVLFALRRHQEDDSGFVKSLDHLAGLAGRGLLVHL